MESWREELYHHGIKGQKWGIRRFQNEDGSYKRGAEGRYDPDGNEGHKTPDKKIVDAAKVIAGGNAEKFNKKFEERRSEHIDAADKAHKEALQKKYGRSDFTEEDEEYWDDDALEAYENAEYKARINDTKLDQIRKDQQTEWENAYKTIKSNEEITSSIKELDSLWNQRRDLYEKLGKKPLYALSNKDVKKVENSKEYTEILKKEATLRSKIGELALGEYANLTVPGIYGEFGGTYADEFIGTMLNEMQWDGDDILYYD